MNIVKKSREFLVQCVVSVIWILFNEMYNVLFPTNKHNHEHALQTRGFEILHESAFIECY